METKYIYSLALLSTIILVMVPIFVFSLEVEVPPSNNIILNALSSLFNFFIYLFSLIGLFIIVVLKYAILAVLWIANGLTLGFVTQVDAAITYIENFFDEIIFNINAITAQINNGIDTLFDAYALIPGVLLLILILPYIIAIIFSFIPS